jgi:hypothetical protein
MSDTISYRLLGFIQAEYCPYGTAQALMADLYNKAVDKGATDAELQLMLASVVVDGLKTDVWPWSPINSLLLDSTDLSE